MTQRHNVTKTIQRRGSLPYEAFLATIVVTFATCSLYFPRHSVDVALKLAVHHYKPQLI